MIIAFIAINIAVVETIEYPFEYTFAKALWTSPYGEIGDTSEPWTRIFDPLWISLSCLCCRAWIRISFPVERIGYLDLESKCRMSALAYTSPPPRSTPKKEHRESPPLWNEIYISQSALIKPYYWYRKQSSVTSLFALGLIRRTQFRVSKLRAKWVMEVSPYLVLTPWRSFHVATTTYSYLTIGDTVVFFLR